MPISRFQLQPIEERKAGVDDAYQHRSRFRVFALPQGKAI